MAFLAIDDLPRAHWDETEFRGERIIPKQNVIKPGFAIFLNSPRGPESHQTDKHTSYNVHILWNILIDLD